VQESLNFISIENLKLVHFNNAVANFLKSISAL